MSKKKKTGSRSFSKVWVNQTNLGRLFGLSAIAVGKILTSHGLKDGGGATSKALSEGWATSTPLKDGTPFFMWNRDRCAELMGKSHQRLSRVDVAVNDVLKMIERAQECLDEGDDKMASLIYDCMYDEVPEDIVDRVRERIEENDSFRICSDCGWTNLDMESSDRRWVCLECGVIHDLDASKSEGEE